MHLNTARIVMIAMMTMTSVCDGRAQTAVDQLQPLVETSARRLNLAQEVAFAKWENGTAVEDPPREELVSTAPVRASSTCRLDLATAVSGYLATHQLSAVDVQATALKQSLAAFCP